MHCDINILGYSGSHISLVFETLTRLGFSKTVRVIMHDEKKYFDVPFETDINYCIVKQEELKSAPPGSFFFCSNNPLNKLFLYSFFLRKWEISENSYCSIIHPSSIVASTVIQKEGLYTEPLSVVSPYTQIGFGVSINRHCSIGHHNILHDFCSIYPGSHLTGDVEIGRSVTIGPGTTIFSGIKIGDRSVIGGGSVVTKNIPPNVLAFGNPCRVIKEISTNKNNTAII